MSKKFKAFLRKCTVDIEPKLNLQAPMKKLLYP